MFNFFEELALDFGLENSLVNAFNLINMSNKLVYVEGHMGVVLISDEVISFRVKKAVASVYGQNLQLKRITKTTLVISGIIKKIESVWLWNISLLFLHLIPKN